MSTTDVQGNETTGIASVRNVDLKLEAVVIPVADVDRSKEFYERLGWRLDADFVFDIEAAREELAARGAEVSEVFHPGEPGAQFHADGSGRVSAPAPDHATYS